MNSKKKKLLKRNQEIIKRNMRTPLSKKEKEEMQAWTHNSSHQKTIWKVAQKEGPLRETLGGQTSYSKKNWKRQKEADERTYHADMKVEEHIRKKPWWWKE